MLAQLLKNLYIFTCFAFFFFFFLFTCGQTKQEVVTQTVKRWKAGRGRKEARPTHDEEPIPAPQNSDAPSLRQGAALMGWKNKAHYEHKHTPIL